MVMDPHYAKHYQNTGYHNMMTGDFNPSDQVQPSHSVENKDQRYALPTNIQNQQPSSFYGSYQNFNTNNITTSNNVTFDTMNVAASRYTPSTVASSDNLFQTNSPSSDNLFQTTIASNDLFPSSNYLSSTIQNNDNFVNFSANNIVTSGYANMYSDLDSIDEATAQNIIDENMHLYTDNIVDNDIMLNEASAYNASANVGNNFQNQPYVHSAPSAVQPNVDSANPVLYDNSFNPNQNVEPVQQKIGVPSENHVQDPPLSNNVQERDANAVTEDEQSCNQTNVNTTPPKEESPTQNNNQETKSNVEVAKTNEDGQSNEGVVGASKDMEKCVREGCDNIAIVDPEWEDEYCSNECCVLHCRNVFQQWVQENTASQPTQNQNMIAT